MKQYLGYLGILVVGLILGWLLFGKTNTPQDQHLHNGEQNSNTMWTCSMHPQIMQPEEGDCPICGMDLIPASTTQEGLLPNEFKLSENAMALANIQTTVIGSGKSSTNTLKLSGKIAENQEANVVQASYFSGRIERLNISAEGEKISKGQLLATIYSPELYAAQQELLTAYKLKDSQPELYKAVRIKLKLWKISDKQINSIETSGKIIENFPIYATVSGTVSAKMVQEGDYVKQGQAMLKIANLNTVWALFDVYENQIDFFKIGQDITISTNAYPNLELESKVAFIDPVLNQKTRTLKLRVVLNNSDSLFKPGMFVAGTINNAMESLNETIVVPATAVLWTGKQSLVYLKTNPQAPIFKMQEVTLGRQMDTQYEVLDGLTIGDEIVTNGTFTVDASAQLQGKKSMMNSGKNKSDVATFSDSLGSQLPKIDLKPEVQMLFNPVLKTYLELKDAFVASNVELAANKSTELGLRLKEIPAELRPQTNNLWTALYEATTQIASSTNLENQRKYFKNLSDKLIYLSSNFKALEDPLYVQFCPMANNNKGAFWLSGEATIKNPYYGQSMLRCGSVEEVLK